MRMRRRELSDSQLADLGRMCKARAEQIREPSRLEEDARAAILAFLRQPPGIEEVTTAEAVRRREDAGTRVAVRKLLRQLLRTPRALRLLLSRTHVTRASNVRQWTIYLMMAQLLDYSEFANSQKTAVVFPYRKKLEAARAVAKGLRVANLYLDLRAESIEKIYRRHFDNH
jgi:hypothetical protein